MINQIKSLSPGEGGQADDGIVHRIKQLAVWYVGMSVLLTVALIYQIAKQALGAVSTADNTDTTDGEARTAYKNTKLYDSQFEEIPHPAESDIYALFRRRFDSATHRSEYLAITDSGETVPIDPGSDMHGYDPQMIQKAEAVADAECAECEGDLKGDRIAFEKMSVGESTTMDILSCADCGSTGQ